MMFGVSKDGHTFKDLAKHYSIYFCGHLHRLIAGKLKGAVDKQTLTLLLTPFRFGGCASVI